MSIKNLDSFLRDSVTIEYEIKGNVIKGDTSALNLLKIANMKAEDELDAMQKTMDIVFGEKNAKFILNNISVAGLTEISNDIAKAMGMNIVEDQSTKK